MEDVILGRHFERAIAVLNPAAFASNIENPLNMFIGNVIIQMIFLFFQIEEEEFWMNGE